MGKFETFTDKAWEFRFNLKAWNWKIILSSEGYSSMNSCENGIESVKENSQNENRFEKKESDSGFRFNLKSWNWQVIGVSETYTTKTARDNWIESVMENTPNAEMNKRYL